MSLRSKKLISLFAAFAILFTLVACSTTPPAADPESTTTAATTTAASTTAATTLPEDPDGPEDPPAEPVKHEVKNLILIIGDGMGPEHIAAGQLAEGKVYDFTRWHTTNVNTDSVDKNGYAGVLTDSAASATALATGTLTYNGYLGIDHKQQTLNTIMDYAKQKGKATGVITTDNLYGATPSGFSAHSANRGDSATITATQITSGVDYLCGLRDDNHYLSRKTAIEAQGYYFSVSPSGLNTTIPEKDKVYLTLDIENSATPSVTLSQVASSALKFLERDEDGFVLVIEQAHIDKYAHSNNIDGVVNSMKSLSATVDTVMEWIGDRTDTAVMITADHETGGLTVSTSTMLQAKFRNGDNSFYYRFTSGDHTDAQVKLFTYGITPDFSTYKYYGANHLIKNTDIFLIMKQTLDKELYIIK